MIYVTHDQEEGLSLSDRIVVMEKGKTVQIDTPENIYYNPANSYVANFVGRSNFIKDEKGDQFILRPEDTKLIENPQGEYIIAEMMFLGHKRELILKGKDMEIEAHIKGIQGKEFNIGDRVDLEILYKSRLKNI